jgi:hypothetical protein
MSPEGNRTLFIIGIVVVCATVALCLGKLSAEYYAGTLLVNILAWVFKQGLDSPEKVPTIKP